MKFYNIVLDTCPAGEDILANSVDEALAILKKKIRDNIDKYIAFIAIEEES